MTIKNLVIVGAGGHGKVVVSAVSQIQPRPGRVDLTDDNVSLEGQEICGIAVRTAVEDVLNAGQYFHVAIGENLARERCFGRAVAIGCSPYAVVHPRASIASTNAIGEGVFCAAGSIVGPDAMVARGVIINHGAIVDHDCSVGAFSHIASNATLGGGCLIGERVLVGAGATLLPSITVGDDVIIGAGAVVVRDVPPGVTVVGVPARRVESRIK